MDMHRCYPSRCGRGDASYASPHSAPTRTGHNTTVAAPYRTRVEHPSRAQPVQPRQATPMPPPLPGAPKLHRSRKKSSHGMPVPPIPPPPPPQFSFIPSPPPPVNARRTTDEDAVKNRLKGVDITKLEEKYWARWKPRSDSQERLQRRRRNHVSPIRQFVANKIAERECQETYDKQAAWCPPRRSKTRAVSDGKMLNTCDLNMTFKKLRFIDDDRYARHKRNQFLVYKGAPEKIDHRRNQSVDRNDYVRQAHADNVEDYYR